MRRKITFFALAAAVAAGAALCAACTKKQPEAATQSKPVVFKAQAPIPVLFTARADGSTGRTGAIRNNYHPQVRFPSESAEITCNVQLPPSTPSIEPDKTGVGSLSCDADVHVDPSKREFVVLEGGSQVRKGAVQLP